MNNYLKYTGVGFEWIGITCLGFFLGFKIDQWLRFQTPWFTMLLAVVFSITSLIIILRRFLREQNNTHSHKKP